MPNLPHPAHFCRRVPIELIQWREPVQSLRPKDEWFPALVEDIRKNGLVNPLFIQNHGEHSMWLATGLNRMAALVEIGWTHVPAVINGPLPPGVEGTVLRTLEEVQACFRDGKARLRSDGLTFSFATLPESKTYPKTTEPYWP